MAVEDGVGVAVSTPAESRQPVVGARQAADDSTTVLGPGRFLPPMGSCIICGTSGDGRICDLHEEDVVFEFRGNHPDQLTVDRYYRGTVDGYAEFGVFVDIGDSVTGLLHRSELEQRLESLDWDPDDTVFVRVQQVRDNGNVDLGWSIRQSEDEFRGTLVDDPAEGAPYVESEETNRGAQTEQQEEKEKEKEDETADRPSDENDEVNRAGTDSVATSGTGTGGAVEVAEPTLVDVGSLEDRVGEAVRIEGVVESAHQTSGPTVFEIRDETGAVDCAAFEEAGVRAYPEIGTDDVVRLDGEVRERRGDIQVETAALVLLEGDEADAVRTRLSEALEAEADPGAVDPLARDDVAAALADSLRDAATAIRRAVLEERPVVVRHAATADGHVAAVALERATLPLVREEHDRRDAVYHYFDRRPLEEGVYDMDDATKDVTEMLEARERHGEKFPLFVFVAAGATRESLDGFGLLDLYGAGRVLVDDVPADPEVGETVDVTVTPAAGDASGASGTSLSANVAAHVNEDVRGDLSHLPAVSFWENPPAAYLDAAADAGYEDGNLREVREAVALEAYYQSYEDKRELITDLLFGDGDGPGGLAGHISEQFRTKLDTEVETAEVNLDHQTLDRTTVAVLDTDAFTHRHEFPPTKLLLDELHRRHRAETDAVVGVADDELHVRSNTPIDVRDVADRARDWVPSAGVTARSARDGKLEYVAGERSAVLDAVIDIVADEVA